MVLPFLSRIKKSRLSLRACEKIELLSGLIRNYLLIKSALTEHA